MLIDDPETQGTPLPLPEALIDELTTHLDSLLSPHYLMAAEEPINYGRIQLSARQDNGYGMTNCGWLVVQRGADPRSLYSWALDDNACDEDAPYRLVCESGQFFLLLTYSSQFSGWGNDTPGIRTKKWLNLEEARSAITSLREYPGVRVREQV